MPNKSTVEDMSELLPCPFCGGKAELIESSPSGKENVTHWQARCKTILSGCTGSEIDMWKCTDEDATQAWNTRSESSLNQKLDELVETKRLLKVKDIALKAALSREQEANRNWSTVTKKWVKSNCELAERVDSLSEYNLCEGAAILKVSVLELIKGARE